MTTDSSLSSEARAARMRIAAILIMLLAAGAALLPWVSRGSGAPLVGSLMIAAGLIEAFAGSARRDTRALAMAAGWATVIAGILFFIDRGGRFVPIVTIVTAWLLVRSVILFVASRRTGASVRTWVTIAAATDLALGVVLLVGISIGTLVVAVFGPTPALVASFSWVLALSFVATGLLLLEVASCEREGDIAA